MGGEIGGGSKKAHGVEEENHQPLKGSFLQNDPSSRYSLSTCWVGAGTCQAPRGDLVVLWGRITGTSGLRFFPPPADNAQVISPLPASAALAQNGASDGRTYCSVNEDGGQPRGPSVMPAVKGVLALPLMVCEPRHLAQCPRHSRYRREVHQIKNESCTFQTLNWIPGGRSTAPPFHRGKVRPCSKIVERASNPAKVHTQSCRAPEPKLSYIFKLFILEIFHMYRKCANANRKQC